MFSAGVAAGGEKMGLPRDSTRDTPRMQAACAGLEDEELTSGGQYGYEIGRL